MVRRVVTAELPSGKSVFVIDDEIGALAPPSGHIHKIWGWDGWPRLPEHGNQAWSGSQYPPHRAIRVTVAKFPPGYGITVPSAMNPAGLHRTETVDIGFIISGEIDLEQDDGVHVTLKAGDVLIQNGARHIWRNNRSEPCVVGLVVLGSAREVESR